MSDFLKDFGHDDIAGDDFLPFSMLLWSAGAIFAFLGYNSRIEPRLLPQISFSITMVNAIVTTIKTLGIKTLTNQYYAVINLLQLTLALPCLTTEFWIRNGISKEEISYVHIGIGILPLYDYFFGNIMNYDLIHLTASVSVTSLFITGCLVRDVNIPAVATSVSFYIAYFGGKNFLNIYPTNLFGIVMFVYSYCGFLAIKDFRYNFELN